MKNLEWLEKMKENDEYKYASCCNLRETFTDNYRKVKALEIIAEGLCLLNELNKRESYDDIARKAHEHNVNSIKVPWPNLKKNKRGNKPEDKWQCDCGNGMIK